MISIRDAIMLLIDLEKTLENKCDLLSSIGIGSTNEEVFYECEQIRNEIVPDVEEVARKGDDILPGRNKRRNINSSGLQKPNELCNLQDEAVDCL